MRRISPFLIAMMIFGFMFFYVPIISMIVFSFNRSRLATLWGGFSTEWYGKLFDNSQILSAAWLSLQIAVLAATLATILGTMAGIALTAPLVMPDVITGISSLMLFIMMAQWIGWPAQRGFTTVLIAQVTCIATYVTTIIQARLTSMDNSIEEAAMDLGSRPWQVLIDITLPVISPAIMSGWLLAFTISLDDVVITSFTTGPGYNTLPMVIWSKVKLGVTPDINALGSIIVAIVALGVAVTAFLLTRAERKRERDIQMAIAANQ
jgi:putrescine transport system permease protein